MNAWRVIIFPFVFLNGAALRADLVSFSSMTGSYDQGTPYVAANSIDGNLGTGWGVFNGQFQIQTGIFVPSAPVDAGEIEFVLSHRFGQNHFLQEFRISTTTDVVPDIGGNWTPVPLTSVFSTNGTTVSETGGGYVRVTGAATGGVADIILLASGGFSGVTGFLLEMEPYDYDDTDTVAASLGRGANGNLVLSEFTVTADPVTNWARFKPVGFFDATGVPVASYSVAQRVENLVDGNPNTFGHPVGQAGVSNDYYAQIDLLEVIAVETLDITGRLDVDCCDDRLENYTLEFYAADGVTQVFSFLHSGQTKATETLDIAAINGGTAPEARYVRIVNTQGTSYGPQIGEVAVYGPLVGAPEAEPFQIISAVADPNSGNAVVNFESVSGAQYDIYGSSNLTAWVPARENITATAETTEVSFMDINMLGALEYYYRVHRKSP